MSDTPEQPKSETPVPQIDEPAKPASTVIAGSHSKAALHVGDLGPQQLRHKRGVWDAFLPNRAVSPQVMTIIIVTEVAIALLIWINSPFKILPRPGDVFSALAHLWSPAEGLGQELIHSFILNLKAVAISAVISLLFSYFTVLPVVRPIVVALSKGRFLSLIGFSLVFTLIVGGGEPLKVSLLTFAMTVFFLTSMASVIAEIPKEEFDHARTLRMSEWRVVWEIVVLGTADKAFEVLRQNAAIGWMMLTMVEGIVRSGGGVGVVLLNEYKYMHLPEVFAIQLLILTVGLFQDYMIGVARKLVCPYSQLTLERKGTA